MVTCPSCGTTVEERAQFCSNCGAALAEAGENRGQSQPATAKGNAQPQPAAESDTLSMPDLYVVSGLWQGFRTVLSGLSLIFAILVFQIFNNSEQIDAISGYGETALQDLTVVAAAGGASALQQSPLTAVLKVLGWVFYNAHFIPVSASASGSVAEQSRSVQESVNILETIGQIPGSPITPVFYYAVPPLLLVLAGRRLTRHRDVIGSESAITGGVNLAIGYAAILAVGTFLVGVEVQGGGASATVAPPLARTVIIGLVYGGLFGAAGGYWGGTYDRY